MTLTEPILKSDRWSRKWLRIILVLAFAIRVLAALGWQRQADNESTIFRFGDSDSYWVLGNAIAKGQPYKYHGEASQVFRAPVYPLVLATVAKIEPKRSAVIAARLVGCLLGTICVFLIFKIVRLADDDRSALMAALLATVYPGAVGMSIFVLSEAVFCPLMLFSLLASYRALKSESKLLSIGWWLVGGAASGLATLARPSWILWPGLLIGFCFIRGIILSRFVKKSDDVRQLKDLRASFTKIGFGNAAFVIAMMLAMLPWWVRNYEVTGAFVPTTLQVGASLYDSFHPGASGSSDEGMAFSAEFAEQLTKERSARKIDQVGENRQNEQFGEDALPFEVVLDRRLKSAAIAWATENPSDVARLALVKFVRTWTPLPRAEQTANIWIRLAEAFAYVWILATGLLAIKVMPRRTDPILIFGLPCIYFAAIHVVFVGSVRYRQPAVLALCALAGIGTAWIVVVCKNRFQKVTQKT